MNYNLDPINKDKCPFCGSEILDDVPDHFKEYKCGTIYASTGGELITRGKKCIENTQSVKE